MKVNDIKNIFRSCLSRRKKNSSLIRRFQILLVAWGLVVYLVSVTGFWLLSNQIIEDNAQRKAQLWASKLDILSAPLYLSQGEGDGEFELIQRSINNISEISYIKLYYANGVDVLGQYTADDFPESNIPIFDRRGLQRISQEQLKDGHTLRYDMDKDSSLMRVIAPVSTVSMSADNILDFDLEADQQETVDVVGYIDLGLDFSADRHQVADYVVKGSLFISILFILASVIGRQLIERTLQPLRDLQEPLDRLGKGETDVLVMRNGDEEIEAISHALNTTVNAIKVRDKKLKQLADFDGLTGLINKRNFNKLLDQECRRIKNEGGSSALFFIDLDQFKYINDTLGHASGDQLLVRIAQLLRDHMRKNDVLARLGGDEFAVLASTIDRQEAIDIANTIVKALYEFRFTEQGKTFNIYCSVGIGLIDATGFSTEEIFSHADMACYCAKSQGRNRFHVYEPDAFIKDKFDIGWSYRIADALAGNKFELHYQPIVSTVGADQPCFEVLLRMIGDNGELIAPNSFISIAERFGLATEIDYWVIENAMRALEATNREGRHLCFYINLSGQLFADPDFVRRVIELLQPIGIDASQIVFELTERTAVGDIHNACQKMELLQGYGFEFAVDDFGSGFSSFTYLKHMPVKYVKIEGEFVEKITSNDVDWAMVKSMVDIAKACGKKVIAEYVGDQETFSLLKRYGVDYVQGFFIAKPNARPIVTRSLVSLPDTV
ncbi:MAG: EAL domain-containing protein [Spongiibacteraceae bacterium]|nr:EAL domain-containing protein [Spongiibacteraceae bacterium]